ncbi:MAG: glycosyltransferase family 8 protein [Kiritimatiellae bacterium]|nr:glycosyltransferase family 8 protein [Kiritimatiellia bacterium]
MKKIFVYATDENFVYYTAVSIVSLLRHNSGVTVVVLSDGLSSSSKLFLASRVSSYGGEFLYFDVSKQIRTLSNLGYNGYTSFLTYARIFIGDCLVGCNDRVLYLDGDTLVDGDLSSLFDFDLRGKPLAFAPDCMPSAYRSVISMSLNRPYFNAGVMLVDLARFRSSRVKSRFLRYLSMSRGVGVFPDQDIFNRFFFDEIVVLPPQYNFITHWFLFDFPGIKRIVKSPVGFTEVDFLSARRKPLIFHFLGNTLGRPWFSSSRHPLASLYRYNARLAGVPPSVVNRKGGFSFVYRLQYFLWRFLPQSVFNVFCSWLYRVHIFLRYRA